MKFKLVLFIVLFVSIAANARIVRGVIKDAKTGEEIIGASVVVKEEPSKGTVSGLNGSFNLNLDYGKCTLICSYIGYETYEVVVEANNAEVLIPLKTDDVMLAEVTVVATNPGRTEAGARGIERKAMNVVNVMSAKAIELSPDITVANVIQRMSGVTVERNSSGEGQYAILRGMDKRYNYTLVNGVKIPSPDNKNRFVPLDIFPSEMLDRLEVTKSLNSMYFGRDFQSFNKGAITKKSPYELKGMPEAFKVSDEDFSHDNLHMTWKKPLPDLTASLSYGDRFFNNKLGVILSGSFLNTYRGKESEIYYQPGREANNTETRNYSDQQTRIGAHAKFDYHISPKHKLTWYNGYMDMRETEVRDRLDKKEGYVRMKWNRQYIINSTLKGEHSFLADNALHLSWSAVLSKAFNETPDNNEISLLGGGNRVAVNRALINRWEHNSDRDKAGYIDLSYKLDLSDSELEFSAGGMFRDKKRDSFFNEYTFETILGETQKRGEDWNNYDEITFYYKTRNISGALNYDATEQIGAGYGMAKYSFNKWEFIAGVRVEHTNQGYLLKYPTEGVDAEGNQKYVDILPSFHTKYEVHENANMRFSYARAINRPSFFEIVPYTILNEDFSEKGNPDLKHTVADNLDLRYEFFPRSSEQFMVGLFYKYIQDPIEQGLVPQGQDLFYIPMNFGDASNLGVEVDVMKYFNWFGIKANYTYTHSKITTDKRMMQGSDVVVVQQTRPLYGQAAHVANLSLLLKNSKYGWEGQIAGSYTGKRLSEVSNYFDDDIWEDGYMQLDASVEKSFKNGISIYAKASNLLDTPLLRFTHKGPHTDGITGFERKNGNLIERKEWHGQSFMLGVRYKL